MQTTLHVTGMTCGHCKASVVGALNELEGVENVEVNLSNGEVEVTYDETKTTLEQMKETVEEQGYDVA